MATYPEEQEMQDVLEELLAETPRGAPVVGKRTKRKATQFAKALAEARGVATPSSGSTEVGSTSADDVLRQLEEGVSTVPKAKPAGTSDSRVIGKAISRSAYTHTIAAMNSRPEVFARGSPMDIIKALKTTEFIDLISDLAEHIDAVVDDSVRTISPAVANRIMKLQSEGKLQKLVRVMSQAASQSRTIQPSDFATIMGYSGPQRRSNMFGAIALANVYRTVSFLPKGILDKVFGEHDAKTGMLNVFKVQQEVCKTSGLMLASLERNKSAKSDKGTPTSISKMVPEFTRKLDYLKRHIVPNPSVQFPRVREIDADEYAAELTALGSQFSQVARLLEDTRRSEGSGKTKLGTLDMDKLEGPYYQNPIQPNNIVGPSELFVQAMAQLSLDSPSLVERAEIGDVIDTAANVANAHAIGRGYVMAQLRRLNAVAEVIDTSRFACPEATKILAMKSYMKDYLLSLNHNPTELEAKISLVRDMCSASNLLDSLSHLSVSPTDPVFNFMSAESEAGPPFGTYKKGQVLPSILRLASELFLDMSFKTPQELKKKYPYIYYTHGKQKMEVFELADLIIRPGEINPETRGPKNINIEERAGETLRDLKKIRTIWVASSVLTLPIGYMESMLAHGENIFNVMALMLSSGTDAAFDALKTLAKQKIVALKGLSPAKGGFDLFIRHALRLWPFSEPELADLMPDMTLYHYSDNLYVATRVVGDCTCQEGLVAYAEGMEKVFSADSEDLVILRGGSWALISMDVSKMEGNHTVGTTRAYMEAEADFFGLQGPWRRLYTEVLPTATCGSTTLIGRTFLKLGALGSGFPHTFSLNDALMYSLCRIIEDQPEPPSPSMIQDIAFNSLGIVLNIERVFVCQDGVTPFLDRQQYQMDILGMGCTIVSGMTGPRYRTEDPDPYLIIPVLETKRFYKSMIFSKGETKAKALEGQVAANTLVKCLSLYAFGGLFSPVLTEILTEMCRGCKDTLSTLEPEQILALVNAGQQSLFQFDKDGMLSLITSDFVPSKVYGIFAYINTSYPEVQVQLTRFGRVDWGDQDEVETFRTSVTNRFSMPKCVLWLTGYFQFNPVPPIELLPTPSGSRIDIGAFPDGLPEALAGKYFGVRPVVGDDKNQLNWHQLSFMKAALKNWCVAYAHLIPGFAQLREKLAELAAADEATFMKEVKERREARRKSKHAAKLEVNERFLLTTKEGKRVANKAEDANSVQIKIKHKVTLFDKVTQSSYTEIKETGFKVVKQPFVMKYFDVTGVKRIFCDAFNQLKNIFTKAELMAAIDGSLVEAAIKIDLARLYAFSSVLYNSKPHRPEDLDWYAGSFYRLLPDIVVLTNGSPSNVQRAFATYCAPEKGAGVSACYASLIHAKMSSYFNCSGFSVPLMPAWTKVPEAQYGNAKLHNPSILELIISTCECSNSGEIPEDYLQRINDRKEALSRQVEGDYRKYEVIETPAAREKRLAKEAKVALQEQKRLATIITQIKKKASFEALLGMSEEEVREALEADATDTQRLALVAALGPEALPKDPQMKLDVVAAMEEQGLTMSQNQVHIPASQKPKKTAVISNVVEVKEFSPPAAEPQPEEEPVGFFTRSPSAGAVRPLRPRKKSAVFLPI